MDAEKFKQFSLNFDLEDINNKYLSRDGGQPLLKLVYSSSEKVADNSGGAKEEIALKAIIKHARSLNW